MEIHDLNAKGKYYVDTDGCYCCAVCVETALNNFKIINKELVSYVFKQPETIEEENQCREALNSCPHEAILDNGETKNL